MKAIEGNGYSGGVSVFENGEIIAVYGGATLSLTFLSRPECIESSYFKA